jgi:hypothetical protein
MSLFFGGAHVSFLRITEVISSFLEIVCKQQQYGSEYDD